MTGIIGTADTSAMIILRAAPTTRLLPVLLLAILVFAFIGQGQGLLDDSCCSALLVSKRRGVVPEDSGLPVLMITTPPGVKIVDEPKVAAKLCVCLPGNQVAASGEARARSAASVVYDGPIGIEVRNNKAAAVSGYIMQPAQSAGTIVSAQPKRRAELLAMSCPSELISSRLSCNLKCCIPK